MKNKFLLASVCILSLVSLLIFCSEDDGVSLYISNPEDGDTLTLYMNFQVSVENHSEVDCVEFYIKDDEWELLGVDSSYEYSREFDIAYYPEGNYKLKAVALMGSDYLTDSLNIYIRNYICETDAPVIINGDTLTRHQAYRNESGCVYKIKLVDVSYSNSDCLRGIEHYSNTLNTLLLQQNPLEQLDLSYLAECLALRELQLNSNNLNDLDLYPLSELSLIEIFNITGNNLTSVDLSPLVNCINIDRLDLSNNCLATFDFVQVSTWVNLLSIDLRNNNINYIDLSPLPIFEELTWLILMENNLSEIDITPLSECEKLISLNLGNNQLTSFNFTPLSGLPDLSSIYLNDNNITHLDLTPLEELPGFQRLHLEGNPLDDSTCSSIDWFVGFHPGCVILSDCP
ncbi:hypothetical protein JXI42_09675 [bacterium]|nr:hypothetical protein [bacterium]